MSRQRFDYCRRARNHMAGQALREGLIMNGERLDDGPNYDDGYPESWPDVKERLLAAYRNLRAFDLTIEQLPNDQESYRFHAQQSVENAVKTWVSAAGLSYRRTHDLDELSGIILDDPEQSSSPAGHQLQRLMTYVSAPDPDYPGDTIDWLTRCAVDYRCSGTSHIMEDHDRNEFRHEITLAVTTIINRVYEITGTGISDLDS